MIGVRTPASAYNAFSPPIELNSRYHSFYFLLATYIDSFKLVKYIKNNIIKFNVTKNNSQ
jgi:hypothetical protein